MEIAKLILYLAFTVFAGFNALCLFYGKSKRFLFLETLFLSYGLGIGLISLEIFLFYIAGHKVNAIGFIMPWAILFAINLTRFFRNGASFKFITPKVSFSVRDKGLTLFLYAAIGVEIFYSFFRALIKPIEAYDAIAIYAIKAKIFYFASSLSDIFNGVIQSFPHPDYPLNIPLSETFAYIVMGGINEQLVKIIFPLFFCGILVLLYSVVRSFKDHRYALVFTFLLASIPQLNAYSANAYLEIALVFYIFAGVLFLIEWLNDKRSWRPFLLSALFMALAGWTKNEGLMYCVISLLLVFIVSLISVKRYGYKILLRPVLYLVIIMLTMGPWIMIKAKYNIINDEINLKNINPPYLISHIDRIRPVMYELQKQLFGPKKWNIFWILFIAAFMLEIKRIWLPPQKYLIFIVFFAFCGYILFYMISYVDAAFFASKTWSRFLLDFLPLLVLTMAYILKDDVNI